MAKLTDKQLLVLDNLIYLREIASGNGEIGTVVKLPHVQFPISWFRFWVLEEKTTLFPHHNPEIIAHIYLQALGAPLSISKFIFSLELYTKLTPYQSYLNFFYSMFSVFSENKIAEHLRVSLLFLTFLIIIYVQKVR